MLAAQLRREALGQSTKVLDLCSGSGILAIVAAESGAGQVTAVDISRRAVFNTWLNAKLNGVSVEVLRGDLLAAVDGRKFDVIVSNPPYLLSASEHLPRRGSLQALDAGPTGRILIDRICAGVEDYLAPGGVLLLVHSSLCDDQRTIGLFEARGYEVSVPLRHTGPLGKRMRARAPMLRARGLLQNGEIEDIVVIRAKRPAAA